MYMTTEIVRWMRRCRVLIACEQNLASVAVAWFVKMNVTYAALPKWAANRSSGGSSSQTHHFFLAASYTVELIIIVEYESFY